MSEEEFLKKIITLYHQARKPQWVHQKIRRGRSHSVASKVEDLFAMYLLKRIKCDLIYVDQPITVDGQNAQIYPDIAIVRKNQITSMCDIKMDLGWKRRELYDFCKKHARLLKKTRGKKCKIRDGLTKRDLFYKIHEKACLNIVIVTDQNINALLLKKHLEKIKPFSDIVKVFILTQGEHPNTYGISTAELMKKIKINHNDFAALVKSL